MLRINWQHIYETNEFGDNQWVLILYDISANHYVGLPVYSKKKKDSTYLKSIDKYICLEETKDYNRSKMNRCIYVNRKPLKISNKEHEQLLNNCKLHYIKYLENAIEGSPDGLSYIKWCKDKLMLNNSDLEIQKLKQNGIYWVNMGYGVGSELRKLRPAILWRSSKDKKVWTIIPLSTKCRKDNYYFHIDLYSLTEGTAKIESLTNYSYKRILTPYFSKGKLAILTDKDRKRILKAISKYYLFQ